MFGHKNFSPPGKKSGWRRTLAGCPVSMGPRAGPSCSVQERHSCLKYVEEKGSLKLGDGSCNLLEDKYSLIYFYCTKSSLLKMFQFSSFLQK